jgi:hypothetical protein
MYQRRAAVGALALSLLASGAEAQSLVGSKTTMIRQNLVAREHDYTFLRNAAHVRKFVDLGLLVRVRGNANYELASVSYPYARPELQTFIERLAAQYRSACGEKLVVTSLTRPLNEQPRNASDLSVHPTGMAVDLRISNRAKCRTWLERTLISLEKQGVLDAIRGAEAASLPRRRVPIPVRIVRGTDHGWHGPARVGRRSPGTDRRGTGRRHGHRGGGGQRERGGGLYCARALRKAPVDVTVIDRRNFHLFQPLLYQVATASLSPADIASPIRTVLRRQGNAQVWLGEVTAVDVAARRLAMADGVAVSYDYLVLATGATHAYFGRDDWAPLAPGLKTIEDATEIRRRFLLAFEAAEREMDPQSRRRLLTFVIVGAGPTGVELAGAMAEIARQVMPGDFRSIDTTVTRIVLVEGPRPRAAAVPAGPVGEGAEPARAAGRRGPAGQPCHGDHRPVGPGR